MDSAAYLRVGTYDGRQKRKTMSRRFAELSKEEQARIEAEYQRMKPQELDAAMSTASSQTPKSAQVPHNLSPASTDRTKEWDVFISHASEDQDAFVRPLAEALAQLGVRIWYSEFSLELGNSLTRSIDKGLAGSRFGLVVVSKSFISKKWPERELQGLVARQMAEQLVILPIWLGVSPEEVGEFSPPLADTVALRVNGLSADQAVLAILRTVRPDIYERHPRSVLENMVRGSALQKLQMELNKTRDELKELIATEIRNIVKFASPRLVNVPISVTEHHEMTPERMKEREARMKIAREITSIVVEAAEDYLREAQARVVEKTDPKRAGFIRNFKPTF